MAPDPVLAQGISDPVRVQGISEPAPVHGIPEAVEPDAPPFISLVDCRDTDCRDILSVRLLVMLLFPVFAIANPAPTTSRIANTITTFLMLNLPAILCIFEMLTIAE